MLTVRQFLSWMATLALLAALAGCGGGSSTIAVSGTVTQQGKPVTGAVVHFVPSSGPAASGEVDASGNYRLSTFRAGDGAVAGTHRVYFTPAPNPVAETADLNPIHPPKTTQAKLPIPEKYQSLQTTPLTVEVQAGTHHIPLELP